jgi:hypothetical protein
VTVKQRNQPSNRGDQPVTFRHKDAQRIAGAVNAHETGRRDRRPSQLPRAAGGGGGGANLMTATFLGSWLRHSSTIINFDGHALNASSTNTASCINYLFSIPGTGLVAHRTCLVSPLPSGNGPDTYFLVNAAY